MHASKKLAVHVAAIGISVGAVAIAVPAAVANASVPHGTAAPTVTLNPDSNVKNNGQISVSGSGFPASSTVYIVECSGTSGAAACDTSTLVTPPPSTDNSGAFSNAMITVHTGAVGSGNCNAGGKCYVAASTSTSPTPPPADAGTAKFTFGGSKGGKTKTSAKFAKSSDKVKGKVTAAGSGIKGLKTVLDIKAHGKWKKLDALKTGKGGKFTSKKLSRSGKYEVKTPKQKHYKASHSKVIKVKV